MIGNLSNLVIKPVFPSRGVQPTFGTLLSAAEGALARSIRASAGRYVAQEQVPLSTVPVWEDGALQPRHLVLRVYAVRRPDPLQRHAGGADPRHFVARRPGHIHAKRRWQQRYLGGRRGATSQFSLLPSSSSRLDVSRATFDLPSRVADNLFWLGRYVERVEPAVRVVRAILPRLFQESDLMAMAGVAAGKRILAGTGYIRNGLHSSNSNLGSLEREVLALIYDAEASNSLPASIHRVRSVGWLLRDRISADAWRILNQLDLQLSAPPPPEPIRISGAQALLDQAVSTLSAFGGLVMESMTRGDGWRFLDIGRRIERAAQMVELIRYGLGFECDTDSGQLEVLLEIADSSITYRSRYLTSMQPELVLDLLLLDEANPRSVAYQLVQLHDHIDRLPGSRSDIRRAPESRIAISLLTAVQLAEVGECMGANPQGRRENLEIFLDRLTGELRLLSETLTRQYFNQAIAARQVSVP